MTTDVRTIVISRLTRQCEDNGRPQVIDDGTSMEELELDSLALIELLYDLEDELSITLDPALLPGVASVGDLLVAVNGARKSRD